MTAENLFFNTGESESGAPASPAEPQLRTGNRPAKEDAKNYIDNVSKEVLSTLTDEEREQLGSQANSLKLIRVLGLMSKPDTRKVGGANGSMVACAKPVVLEFQTDVELDVPVLPLSTNVNSDIDYKNVETRKVAAGEKFQVTYFEAMLLLIRDEFMGSFHANGKDNEGYLQVSLPKFLDNQQKIPTPAFGFKTSPFKEDIYQMDEKNEDGSWSIKEEFAHYGDLLKKRRESRDSGAGKSRTKSIARHGQVSLTLQKVFGMR